MNVLCFVRKWSLVLAVTLLTGCATPKPILDLAGQGAATVGLAEISLRDYLALTNSQLAARMDLLRQDAQQEASDRARREFDLFIDRRAGVSAKDDAADLIRSLGTESRQIREHELTEIEKIAKSFSLDVATSAQVPTEKLAAAKKGFSVLAQELSPKEWVVFAAGYAKEIQAGVKNLKASTKDDKENAK